jgi:hypothetical protein
MRLPKFTAGTSFYQSNVSYHTLRREIMSRNQLHLSLVMVEDESDGGPKFDPLIDPCEMGCRAIRNNCRRTAREGDLACDANYDTCVKNCKEKPKKTRVVMI